jgi:N-acetylmuramoyl-L-alanine amidase
MRWNSDRLPAYRFALLAGFLAVWLIAGCQHGRSPSRQGAGPNPDQGPHAAGVTAEKTSVKSRTVVGQLIARRGQEIVVCGKLINAGTPVVLWMDPGGYDAYRVEKRFSPIESSGWPRASVGGAKSSGPASPNRYGLRKAGLSKQQIEQVRGGGWDLPLLQQVVDQFVIHYDVCGTSRQCFKVLHDIRGLSVHFMLDIDGTIYQTLDLKERAWHATISNDRSIGIEIANIGAYRPPASGALPPTLDQWYETDKAGRTRITIPAWMKVTGVRTQDFVGRPIRSKPVTGRIQGGTLVQYDLTVQQYAALTKLTAALCKTFPKMNCDYPKDKAGKLVDGVLSKGDWDGFGGILGHYHVQKNKIDPGPAFQWDRVIQGARRELERTRATGN